jgi:spermidine/putrescine-binding protein
VRIVVWRGYDDPKAAGPFLARTGIELESTYVDADEDAATLLREAPGRYDAVAVDNRYVPQLADEGLIAPLDPALLPALADAFPRFRELGQDEDGRTWSAPYIWGRHPLAYNARLVANPPSTWLDVTRPEFHGRVAMVDGCVHQLVTWGRVLGYPDPVRITPAELRAAADLAVRVKRETAARLVPWDELPGVLARGEAVVATAGWEAVRRFAAEQGGEIGLVYPPEEAYPWLDSWCLVRGSRYGEAVHAWIDWMISPEAQRVVTRNLPCGTANARAVDSLDAEVREAFPHERIDELMERFYVGMPPRRSDDGVATLADWADAWEEVRAA